MKLDRLTIEQVRYGTNKGAYEGTISFHNELGKVAIRLSPAQCDELFKICADGIVATAKAAAAELTISVIEHADTLKLSEENAK